MVILVMDWTKTCAFTSVILLYQIWFGNVQVKTLATLNSFIKFSSYE